jgi:uncharacterized alpha-E superfamily protein
MSLAPPKPLLSRVAEAVYWLGRYIERAENVVRFLDVNLNLTLDLPHEAAGQWQPIVNVTGDRAVFLERYGVATQESVVRFLAFDAENPNSILSSVTAARENARSVRETISSEMWQQINGLYLLVAGESRREAEIDLPAFCHQVRMACHLIHGLLHVTMSHNEAWQFILLGTLLERADKTTRILDVKYFILLPSLSDVGTPYDDVQWSAVLKSVSGFEMYRKRHGRLSPPSIVEFLLLDGDFPRSVRYCISVADGALHQITGTPRGTFACQSEQRLGALRGDLEFAAVDAILTSGLHEFCDSSQSKLNAIDESIFADFFAQRPLAAHA